MRGTATQTKATVMANPDPEETEPPPRGPDPRADRITPTLPSTRHVVRTVLLYGVFGPPIGAFPIILGSISSYGATDSVTETLLTAWPWIYFSYFSGLVPALITGYFVEHLPRRWPAVGFVSCAGLI